MLTDRINIKPETHTLLTLNPRSLCSFRIQPQFEDVNATIVLGEIGGSVTLDCNIFMLQDHTVSAARARGGRMIIRLLLLIMNWWQLPEGKEGKRVERGGIH
jgi:hypothetical protein